MASLEKNRDEKDEHLDSLYQKIDMQTARLQDALRFKIFVMNVGLQ